MNLSQKHKVWIGIGIVIILMLVYIFWPKRTTDDNTLKEYLQRQNDSLKAEIEKERELRIAESQRIDSVLNVINETDFKIIRSKEYHERIIHHYDTASIKQLEEFFQSRYDSQNK